MTEVNVVERLKPVGVVIEAGGGEQGRGVEVGVGEAETEGVVVTPQNEPATAANDALVRVGQVVAQPADDRRQGRQLIRKVGIDHCLEVVPTAGNLHVLELDLVLTKARREGSRLTDRHHVVRIAVNEQHRRIVTIEISERRGLLVRPAR